MHSAGVDGMVYSLQYEQYQYLHEWRALNKLFIPIGVLRYDLRNRYSKVIYRFGKYSDPSFYPNVPKYNDFAKLLLK
jgi:hypothetical protein